MYPEYSTQNCLFYECPLSLDQLFALSLKDTDGMSDKSLAKNLFPEEIAGLEAYNELVEFKRDVYLKLRKDLFSQIDESSRLLARSLVNSRNEYYVRASMQYQKILNWTASNPISIAACIRTIDQNLFKQCQNMLVSPTFNSNPMKWPWAFEEFHQCLRKQENLSLFYEPPIIRHSIDQNLERMHDHPLISKVLTQYSVKVGTFLQMLKLCQLDIKDKLVIHECMDILRQQFTHKKFHYMRNMCDLGAFNICQLTYLNNLTYGQVSLATSPGYLYLYISNANGMMLKIGSGHGTVAGKIYLHVPVKKSDEVNWVYLQNKLYLKTSSKENCLDIICPETFTVQTSVALHCPEIFQQAQNQIINKQYPLLTDGEKLYIIGRKLNITKLPQSEQVEDEKKEKVKEKAERSSKKSSKKEEAPTDTNTQKILDFILYEFDLNKPSGALQDQQDTDKKLLKELYDSFQGYFTKSECAKALNLHKNDVQNAAFWLTEEGERERSKTTLIVSSQTLLAQSEIVSEIPAKLKSFADIQVREHSLLTPASVSQLIWTMDKQQISVYTDTGIRIFSKDPKSEKPLTSESEFNILDHFNKSRVDVQSKYALRGTYITTVDKHQCLFTHQPNYLVSYEPHTAKFYTVPMNWGAFNNLIQAVVTVSADYNQYNVPTVKISDQAQFHVQVSSYLLNIQQFRYSQPYRLTDWKRALDLMITEITTVIGQLSDEDKKKAISERTKYISKLNKIKSLIPDADGEIKKSYAYSIEGSLEELKLIWQLFKQTKHPNYFQMIELWVKHSDQTIVYQSQELEEITQYFYENKNLIIPGWAIFLYSNTNQLLFFKQDNVEPLLQQIIIDNSNIDFEFYLKDSAYYHISKSQELHKQTISPYCKQSRLIQPLSRLCLGKVIDVGLRAKLFPNEQDFDTTEFWELCRKWAGEKNEIKGQFMEMVFKQAYSAVSLSENEWHDKYMLVKNILSIYEISVPYNMNNFLISIFQASIVLQPIDISLTQQLIRIYHQMHQLLNTEKGNLLDMLPLSQSVGVDQIIVKTFETGHPYERQKTQTFEDTYFPGAIALIIEFDQRCSSDQAHDFLTLQSWYSSGVNIANPSPQGAFSQLKDPIGVAYRISGKPNTRRPLVMIGNTINGDFSPAGQARNEHSLNRWGYKLNIRPIYGIKELDLDIKSSLSQKQIVNIINSMKTLNMVIIENINSLLGFSELRIPEEDCQFLKWTLLKNGSTSFKLDKFLMKVMGQMVIEPLKLEDAQYLKNSEQITKSQYTKYWSLKRELFKMNYEFRPIVKPQIEYDLWQLVIQNKPYMRSVYDKCGDFFVCLVDIVKNFSDSFQFKQEKLRAAYKMYGADLWHQVEILLISTILYHSGLISSEVPDIKGYLKDHLQMLQEARNEVISFMIREVQTEVEYQQNFETLMLVATEVANNTDEQKQTKPVEDQVKVHKQPTKHSFKQERHKKNFKQPAPQVEQQAQAVPPKELEISPEMENKLWMLLSQRLEGNQDMTNRICNLKKITINTDDQNQTLKNLFQFILTRIKGKESMKEMQSAYVRVGNEILQKILLLQLVNNLPLIGDSSITENRKDMSVDSESFKKKLRPPGLERSISHQVDDKNIDTLKLQKFRQWLDSYQRWKQLHTIHKSELTPESVDIPPVKSIIQFLKSDVSNSLLEVMRVHDLRCVRRIAGMRLLNEFSSIGMKQYTSGGILCQGDLVNHRIELASSQTKEALLTEAIKRLAYLMSQVDVTEFAQFSQVDQSLESLKQLCLNLTEINQLFQIEKYILWRSSDKNYNPRFNPLFKSFLERIILAALLSIVFVSLDQQYQAVANLSHHILYTVKTTLYILTDNLPALDLVNALLSVLRNELGINDVINARLLVKLRDLIGAKRVNFLLQHIYDVLLIHNTPKDHQELSQTMMIIIYHSNCPSTVRLASRIYKLLDNDHSAVFDINYEWKTLTFEPMPKFNIKNFSESLSPKLMILEKVNSIFDQQNPIQAQISDSLSQVQQKNNRWVENDKRYKVVIHLCQEEEISILIKVLYWWEELYPQLKGKLPTTLQEYFLGKEKERRREEQKLQNQEVIAQQSEQQSRQSQTYKQLERVILTYPEVPVEGHLGIGFNYSNIFGDFKSTLSENRKSSSGRVKKQIKKYWRPLNFLELERLYEELSKQNDDIKDIKDVKDPEEYLKQRNFISRMWTHIREVKNYGSLFTVYGCISFTEVFTLSKAEQLMELFQLAIEDRLPAIPMDGFSEEFRTKADPNKYILIGPIKEIPAQAKKSATQQKATSQIAPQPTTGKSQMVVSLCDYQLYLAFEFRMDYITLLPYGNSNTSINFYNEVNRSSLFTQQFLSGPVKSALLRELINIIPYQIDDLFLKQKYQIPLSLILSGWLASIGPGSKIMIKDQEYIIIQHGQKQSLIISPNDEKANLIVHKEELTLQQNQLKLDIAKDQQKLVLQLILSSNDLLLKRNLLAILASTDLQLDPQDLLSLSEYCKSVFMTTSDHDLLQSWERMIEQNMQVSFPLEITPSFPQALVKQSSANYSHLIDKFKDTVDSTTMVGSSYISSLPESAVVNNEQKLVAYWEKNILPKINDYVKGSLRQFEIDDFFEQMRQPLRKGDQAKALEIAYIVCDQRMPNGAVIPDVNHDWSTLTMEELKCGQFVLARLADKSSDQLYSKEYILKKRQGLQYISGQIIGVDQRSSSVLVLTADSEYAQQYATWFPSSALKQIQAYQPPPPSSYTKATLQKKYTESLQVNISEISKSIYRKLNSMNFLTQLDTWEIKGSCVDGWLTCNEVLLAENQKSLFLELQENHKQQKVFPLEQFDEIFTFLTHQFSEMEKSIQDSVIHVDLLKMRNPELLISGNSAGVVIVFQSDATLCMCSGVKFFTDPQGINEFYTMASGKEQRNKLAPIVFNKSTIYAQYYFNAEAIPLFQQQSCVSRLHCIVYEVPKLWNATCLLLDQLTTSLLLQKQAGKLQQILTLLETIYQGKQNLFAQSITKLMIRALRKMRVLSTPKLSEEFKNARISEVKILYDIQRIEPQVLFSSFLQDLVEMIALSDNSANLPEFIKGYAELIQITEFMKDGKAMSEDLKEKLNKQLVNSQFDQILYLKNLPDNLILGAIQQSKARILNPITDIIYKDNEAFVILDGWASLDLEEVSLEKKNSEQPPQEEAPKFWQCEICTCAENAWEAQVCSVCESPAPSVKVPYGVEVQEDIVQVDVNQEDQIAEEKCQQQFQSLIDIISQTVQKYYDQERAKTQLIVMEYMQQIESLQGQIKQLQKKRESENKKVTSTQRLSKIMKQKKGQVNVETENASQIITNQISTLEEQIKQLEDKLIVVKEQFNVKNNFEIIQGKQALNHEFVKNCLKDRQEAFKTQEDFIKLESQGIDFWMTNSSSDLKILNLRQLQQLIKFIEHDVCKETKAVISYKAMNIRFTQKYENPINYGEYVTSISRYPELANQDLGVVRTSWALIRQFNSAIEKCGYMINMDIQHPTYQFVENQVLLSMANYLTVLRRLIMNPIKIDLVQRVLTKTSLSRDGPPKITVERLKLTKNLKAEQLSVKSKDDYLFTMAHDQMSNIAPTQLRPIKPQGTDPFLAFELNFKGEDVQGESGPYRQFFADISRELQPGSDAPRNLNLLYPSMNNQAKLGDGKDKFVLNPSAVGTYQIELYEFLGILFGVSMRTATHFTLDLARMFWKRLVGEYISIEDIEETDGTMCQLIQFMQECSEELFEEKIFENWVTVRSDRSLVELKPDGANIPVTYNDRIQFIKALVNIKLTEAVEQTNAIKQGLIKIIPRPLLNCKHLQYQVISAEDLEIWVCGRPTVDVDLLRRHTRYAGELNEQSKRVIFLWEALQEFSEQEKLRFVKFCWGQERLPSNDDEFERNQIRFMIKPATYATRTPDKALPKADTCFFNLELPNYSSKDILKEKILTAINTDCDSMNAEQRINLDPNARHRRGRDQEEDQSVQNEDDEEENNEW